MQLGSTIRTTKRAPVGARFCEMQPPEPISTGEACSFRLAKTAWWMCYSGSPELFVPEWWCFRASSCLVCHSEWLYPVPLYWRAACPFRALRYLPAEWPFRRAELPSQQVVWQFRLEAWQSLYPVPVLEQPSAASPFPAQES